MAFCDVGGVSQCVQQIRQMFLYVLVISSMSLAKYLHPSCTMRLKQSTASCFGIGRWGIPMCSAAHLCRKTVHGS